MKQFTCIVCPKGCNLVVEEKHGEVVVSGNDCIRGYTYALQEYVSPARIVTANIRIDGGEFPVLPVKTSGEVPMDKVLSLVETLKKVKVAAPIKAGDVILAAIYGVDIIATKTINKAE